MSYRVVRCACGQEMRVPPETLHRYGKCVACEARLKITEANSRLVDTPSLPKPAAPAHSCTRCGETFKGDWDRVESNDGFLCNRCARQIALQPRLDKSMAPASTDPVVAPVSMAQYSTITPPKKPRKKPTRLEIGILAGITIVLFGLLYFLPVERMIPELLAPPDPAEVARFSSWQRMACYALLAAVGITAKSALITILLGFTGRMPSEDAVENFKAIVVAAVALYLVSFVPFSFIIGYFLLAWLFGLDVFQVPAYFLASLLAAVMGMLLEAFAMGLLLAALA